MRNLIIGVISLTIVLIFTLVVYWNLPYEITRKSDIEFGNFLVENIEKHRQENNKLPNNDDWETLKKLGFNIELIGTNPNYETDNKGNYELVFLEGFDGPYLMWNSIEKKWKIDFPTIFQ